MKVREIMTRNPSWCLSEDPSSKAAAIMKEKNIGAVPVVKSSSDRRVVGMVTDRDLCLAVVATSKDPSTVRVAQCMTTTIVACGLDEDVERAAQLIHDNQIRRLPIVDKEGVLQGMIGIADIWQRSNLSSDKTHQTLKKVTEPMEQASTPRAQMMKAAA